MTYQSPIIGLRDEAQRVLGSTAPIEDRWHDILMLWGEADTLYQGIDHETLGDPAVDADTDRLYEIHDALLETPAPDHAAVILKIEMAHERYDGSSIPDEDVAHIVGDVRRLGEAFARSWLAQWTGLSGSVTRDPRDENKVWIGQPEYHCSPAKVEDDARMTAGGLPEDQRDWQAGWLGAFYSGKMRALYEMLDAVPGGLVAVKALINADPSLGFNPAAMACSADEAA